jgi:hypothetical protein
LFQFLANSNSLSFIIPIFELSLSSMIRFFRGIFLFLLINASLAQAQNTFAPFQLYTTGSKAEVSLIVDINNDGLKDVVVGTRYDNDTLNDYKLNIFYQTASGTLAPLVKISYRSGFNGLNTISSGDLNNDSLTDLVIGFDDSIGVFYQNHFGTLNPQVNYFAGFIVLSVKKWVI